MTDTRPTPQLDPAEFLRHLGEATFTLWRDLPEQNRRYILAHLAGALRVVLSQDNAVDGEALKHRLSDILDRATRLGAGPDALAAAEETAPGQPADLPDFPPVDPLKIPRDTPAEILAAYEADIAECHAARARIEAMLDRKRSRFRTLDSTDPETRTLSVALLAIHNRIDRLGRERAQMKDDLGLAD